MAYRYTIDTGKKLIREVFGDLISAEAIIQAIHSLTLDEDFHPDLDNCVDMRNCSLSFGLRDLPKIVSVFGEVYQGGAGRTAILVDNPKNTALTMLFQKKTSGRRIAIFSTEEKAFEWLGVAATRS